MIRKAGLEDASALSSLPLLLGYTDDTTESITRLEKIIIQENAAFFVKEVNGAIAGSAPVRRNIAAEGIL